jgi:hypothetical protein
MLPFFMPKSAARVPVEAVAQDRLSFPPFAAILMK